MKTQKSNEATSVTNTGKRNFFKKTLILLAILTFTGFGFKAKAQMEVDANNLTSAPIVVVNFAFKDALNNTLSSFSANGIPGPFDFGCETGTVDHIDVSIPGCLNPTTYGSGGVFGTGAITVPCGAVSNITALSVTTSTTQPSCGGTGTLITIEIK